MDVLGFQEYICPPFLAEIAFEIAVDGRVDMVVYNHPIIYWLFIPPKGGFFGISEASTASIYSLRPPDLRKTHRPHEVPNFDSATLDSDTSKMPWSPH